MPEHRPSAHARRGSRRADPILMRFARDRAAGALKSPVTGRRCPSQSKIAAT